MTTDDFREKVEKLGFKTYRGNNTISIERSGVTVASISVNRWARYDFSSRKLVSAGKMPQLTKLLAEYGDTPVEEREEAYYRLWIPRLSVDKKAYVSGASSDMSIISYTYDKKLADKLSERGASDMIYIFAADQHTEVRRERI
jgi:hypothetical protein|nr:MAG TPA: hypothetical protein [Caudoviricetes sp.]